MVIIKYVSMVITRKIIDNKVDKYINNADNIIPIINM